MSLKQAYQQKIEVQVEKFDAEIARIEAEAKKRKAELKEMRIDASLTVQAHLRAMRDKRFELGQKLGKLKTASQESFDELKSGIEKAGSELEASLDKIRDTFKTAVT